MLRSLFASAALVFIFSCSVNSQRNSIQGIWYFDRFGGPHGEIAESPEAVKANRQNEGTMFNFTADNKLITSLQGGSINNNNTQNYQVLSDRRQIIIGGDTMQIMLLTPDILELYPITETKPAVFFKRTKDGKTSISAP
jgi:hypothetical protein